TFSGIDIVDADCVPGPVDLEVVVDLNTLPAGLDNESPWQQGGDDRFDSDCEAGVIACAAYDASTERLDCGFFQIAEEFCRTPGYWGTHPGVIDANGLLPFDICGGAITVDTTSALLPGSTSEAICTTGGTVNHLGRNLVSTALNCIVTNGATDCSGVSIAGSFADCNAACAVINDPNSTDEDVALALIAADICSAELDCWNNGGQTMSGMCVTGTCSQDGAYCASSGDCVDIDNPDATCDNFANSCHDREFPDDFITMSADPTECKAAKRSRNCSIYTCP
ncbi:MAG: hypothetical protein OEM62_10630, partial [Acidobacteriota bacterium]|nr:hypothetical protein [Acidobacteriota bacterium]